jgi:hypothetical protein
MDRMMEIALRMLRSVVKTGSRGDDGAQSNEGEEVVLSDSAQVNTLSSPRT